jgi:hypothetical protein
MVQAHTVTVLPSLRPSSVEARSGLVGVATVEVLDNLSGMLEIAGRLCGRLIITSPLH